MMVTCQERILVVEDEEDLGLILQTRLESAGYEVHLEPRGSAGVEYAIEHQPDLVILDVRLPDLHGFEVCRQLRQRYGHEELPVLMFTVMDGPMDDIHGFASGANAYLPKTCEPVRLLDAVERLLHGEEVPPGPRL
ncbi:MAG: response regulator [Candidatus Omnitrophica bacterium]|nr:response regulator [Candidatus Omnitrophota bacterium]